MTAPSILAKGLGGLEPLVGLQVKTYGTGRVCAVCGVPLSRYNPDPVCWLHRDEAAPETATFGERRCRLCKDVFPASTEHFHRDRANKAGLKTICKECVKAECERRYRTDPERYRKQLEHSRAQYAKRKAAKV